MRTWHRSWIGGVWLLLSLAALLPGQTIDGDWESLAPMPTNRSQHSVTEIGNRLYVVGGQVPGPTNVLEIYDVDTNTWSTGTPDPTTRSMGAAVTFNGEMYYVGGFLSANGANTLNLLERYDPIGDSWTTLASAPTARGDHVAEVIGGDIYVAGGVAAGFSSNVGTVDIYDPITDTWSTAGATMPTPVEGAAAGVIDGRLYVAGGLNRPTSSTFTVVDELQIYDPIADTWTTGPNMPTALAELAGGVIDGKLYVTSGQPSGGGLAADLLVFDPVLNQWFSGPDIPTSRTIFDAGVINGTLYAVGGIVVPSPAASTDSLEAFTPLQIPEPGSLLLWTVMGAALATAVLRRRFAS